MTESDPSATAFHDLDAYIDLPRGSGLALSPDGTRLVTAVQTLNPKRTKFVTALWEVDPTGERPAHRLTRSAKGEGGAAFLPDGSLLFVSARPDPATDDDEKDDELGPVAAARRGWRGARRLLPPGWRRRRPRRQSGTVVVAAGTFPSSTDEASEKDKRKERKEKKVTAILHESVPVRFWDHDLGPDVPRLFAGSLVNRRRRPRPRAHRPDAYAGPRARGGAVRRVARRLGRRHHLGRARARRPAFRDGGHRRRDRGAAGAARRPGERVRLTRGSAPTAASSRSSSRSARRPPTRATAGSPWSPWPTGTCATSPVTGTAGRVSPSGRRTGRPWCCTPTRTVGRRCSGSTSRRGSSPG